MSARRFLVCAVVVIVAVLCTPAMLVPGFNSADAIVIAAPIVLVVVGLWPRRRCTPVGAGDTPTPGTHASLASTGLAEIDPVAAATEARLDARAARLGYER